MQQLQRHRHVQDAVIGGHLVVGARQRALGAGAVVAADVDDQRVVELAHVLDCLDDAADFVVGVRRVAGEDLRLPRIELLLQEGKRVPLRQLVRPGRELGVGRDHAEAFLVGKDLVAHLLPAHVELALELGDPLLGRLMRRVGAARNVVHEERLVGRHRVEAAHVLDRLVREVGGEVVAGLPDPREDLRVIAEQIRLPLVGLAAHEPVEVLEAHPRWPLVEGAGDAVLEARRIVILAEPRRGVAVFREDAADRRVLGPDDRVVAGIARREFRDHAKADRVVVAAGDQRRPRRRAQRGRVEFV